MKRDYSKQSFLKSTMKIIEQPAYPTATERDEALVSELEHSIQSDLRRLEQLKGEPHVKHFLSHLLPF